MPAKSETSGVEPAVQRRSYLDPIVVRPHEACRMLSVGLTRLYELLHEGQLESFRYGRSRRITVASIHAYVERQLAEHGGIGAGR